MCVSVLFLGRVTTTPRGPPTTVVGVGEGECGGGARTGVAKRQG